jgi:predicted ATP-dependent protease
LLDLVERRILAFEPYGEAAGQLYGIAVITVGDEAFGRPMRVMATAFVGTGGVSNLEREVAMSGPIHSKAFLLLSGYVARRFARRTPLVLSATISFEQVYEEIEGDSASPAELYALLSAVSEVPIRQGIAVTGAVNRAVIERMSAWAAQLRDFHGTAVELMYADGAGDSIEEPT